MARYLVISPNGYGNVGDDICAYGGEALIRSIDKKAKVIITQPPMHNSLVEWADCVVLSGGGIIYDRAPDNVDNYLQYIDLADRLGKKKIVLGVGVQGIITEEGKKRYKESLSKCDYISVRTDTDKQMLKEIGIKNVAATFDVAFHFPEIAKDIDSKNFVKKIKSFFSKSPPPPSKNKKNIGLCLINLKALKKSNYTGVFQEFDEAVEDFLKNKDPDIHVYFLQHAKEDGKFMKRLSKKYGGTFVPYKDIEDAPKLLKLYMSLDIVVGLRLHSIALGLMANKPVVAIGSPSTKQMRLANYCLPTLKKQFIPLTDKKIFTKFFDNLKKADNLNSYRKISSLEQKTIKAKLQLDRQKISATIEGL